MLQFSIQKMCQINLTMYQQLQGGFTRCIFVNITICYKDIFGHFHTKILSHVFSDPMLFINLFVLTVMLVMQVKCTNISQPGLMNTLIRIKSHTYQHLVSSADCQSACSRDCFSILDIAKAKRQLCIKGSLFISQLKPKHHFFVFFISSLLALFPFVTICFTVIPFQTF